MGTDPVLFMAFGVPLVCFVVAWFVFFGKRNGTFKMTWGQLLIIEAGLLFLGLASYLLAADIIQRM